MKKSVWGSESHDNRTEREREREVDRDRARCNEDKKWKIRNVPDVTYYFECDGSSSILTCNIRTTQPSIHIFEYPTFGKITNIVVGKCLSQ